MSQANTKDYMHNAIRRVRSAEGIFSRNADDPGGMTYCGIARNRQPDWDGWKFIDSFLEKKIGSEKWHTHKILEACVQDFYQEYYHGVLPDDFPSHPIIIPVFSMAFVAGKKAAIRTLQRAARASSGYAAFTDEMVPDGSWGPITHRIISSTFACTQDHKVFYWYLVFACKHFERLAMANPKLRTFLHGWYNRAIQDAYWLGGSLDLAEDVSHQ